MDTGSDLALLFRGVLALAVVVTLAVVSLRVGLPWLLRRAPAAGRRLVEIEESYPLDRQHRLFVVRFDGERLLVATSPGQVALLARGPAPAEPGRDPGGGA